MKENKKNFFIAFILFALSIIIALVFYDKLPAKIPLHYNFDWQADFYAKKINALLFVVGFMVLIYLALYFILSLDPKKYRHDKNYKNISLLSIPILNLLIIVLTIWKNYNENVQIGRILIGIIAIFIGLSGIFLPRIKRNYTLGIKTPWALEKEIVWKKTQKFGSLSFILTAILSLIGLIFSTKIALYILLGFLILSFILTYLYSYLVYRKLGK